MINRIKTVLVVLAFAKAIISCHTANPQEQEIKSIPLQVDLIQFHEEFATAPSNDLDNLKGKYPAFFPKYVPDSVWMDKMEGRDTIQNVLEEAVGNAGFDFEEIKEEIELVMKHVEYYFPEFEPTPIITVLSEVDNDLKVLPTPNYLIIGIDNYLGADHELYAGINRYKAVTLERDRIPADVALAYAKLFVPPTNSRQFLEQMIYYGKLHYLQQNFAPSSSIAQIMGYAEDKAQFSLENEEQIYRYFVDRELLYSTDPKLLTRFILPAPFSKFYLEIDNETPGGVAQYIGWQIVASYAENNNASLQDVINTPAEEIFNQSRYKPRS
ncbi:gliding motility protein [Nonlabens sp. YIK11]|uniref:gliding motility lipoprotein GldB n=1 Tax=Nonlabens sp. YIK11 TaxID=1453349 RepID=UPI0006DC9D4A|nr:hypothetical protein [Nonlabens sp. YIK11]KQC32806.1 gliding motility protein [Nonlabens sp. YIK11]